MNGLQVVLNDVFMVNRVSIGKGWECKLKFRIPMTILKQLMPPEPS
jgi:hypothetical protein